MAQITSYDAWLLHEEASLFWPANEVPHRLSALPYHPSISVLLTNLNADTFHLQRCLESVVRQHYTHWQLCVPNDGAVDLARLASTDKRFTLAAAGAGLDPSQALTRGLQSAQGDFIVTLDPQDQLHPSALLEVARLLNERDNCELVYSDQDKINIYGARSDPFIKPDIDLDMILAVNYVGRLTALRRTTVNAIGGFRPECGVAQEWDLILRLLEKVGPESVQHIAKPLYHCGLYELQARKALVRVLSDYIVRTATPATIEPGVSPHFLRLKYSAPATAKVAVFIRLEDGDFQLQTVRALANRGREISIHQIPAGGVDPGDHISADVFIFINRPLETLNHFFIEELTAQALRPECGLVTGISVDAQGQLLHQESPQQANLIRSVRAISGEFFAVRREYLTAVSEPVPQLLQQLLTNAHQLGLRVIVTPFAIASLHPATSTPALSNQQTPMPVARKFRFPLNFRRHRNTDS